MLSLSLSAQQESSWLEFWSSVRSKRRNLEFSQTVECILHMSAGERFFWYIYVCTKSIDKRNFFLSCHPALHWREFSAEKPIDCSTKSTIIGRRRRHQPARISSSHSLTHIHTVQTQRDLQNSRISLVRSFVWHHHEEEERGRHADVVHSNE